jgi:hypothetical protein
MSSVELPAFEMSGEYEAFLEFNAAQELSEAVVPTIDDTICYLRWRYPEMIETLDDRMRRQRVLVMELLLSKGKSPGDLMKMTQAEVDDLDDVELRLCYHILRDVAYIDSLR